jgi:arylsulfatase A-like enzyme
VANLDYCGRETGLSRGFAHYEDYPLELWDGFTRYVGIGHRIDFFSLACLMNKLLERYRGGAEPILPRASEHTKDGALVNRQFLKWLSWQRKRGRPFFAFLNYNDAHVPYDVPDRSVPGFGLRPQTYLDRLTLRNWNALEKIRLPNHSVELATDGYDDCILYLDRRLEQLVAGLRVRGVLDDTLLIVTSDHGEHLGDHLLFFHGCSLYRQLLEVPLVIVGRADLPAGRIVDEPVSLCDLPATVVDLLGLARDAPFPGRSLARFWSRRRTTGTAGEEPILMETQKPLVFTNQGREPAAKGAMQALVAGGMHYIRAADGQEELYVLESDPQERMNIALLPAAQKALEKFRDALAATLQGAAGPAPRDRR